MHLWRTLITSNFTHCRTGKNFIIGKFLQALYLQSFLFRVFLNLVWISLTKSVNIPESNWKKWSPSRPKLNIINPLLLKKKDGRLFRCFQKLFSGVCTSYMLMSQPRLPSISTPYLISELSQSLWCRTNVSLLHEISATFFTCFQ